MTKARKASIRPYLRNTAWWARVPRLGAVSVPRSLGVRGESNRDRAVDVCAFLWTLKARRESWLLDELAAGRISIGDAYDAEQNRRLDTFIADAKAGRTDPDIEPMVALWAASMAQKRKPAPDTAAKYVRQVRTLLVAGKAFKRSALTRGRISTWLAGLNVGQPNRHRAALSRFCRFLMERDVLETNPVRAVEAARENAPRCRYLEAGEVTAVLDALPEPFRTIHALMNATGMEISAVLKLHARDVDLTANTVHARGTKRASRNRTVRILDARARSAMRAALHGKLPGAPLFAGVTSDRSLDELRAACKAVQVADYTQHDWRHTFAVREIRRGQPLSVIAHQLGHGNTMMVQKVYGRFTPDASDYLPDDAHKVHENDTSPQNAARPAGV